ncbi:MAG: GNAT family N-acetyltransferase [Bifidobacteriaceae bacterium]|jgi:phosphinothricin acetyltransferase|nr:GNAT family N-acetyltransferase [Bifidobacteriaceae bacterium]
MTLTLEQEAAPNAATAENSLLAPHSAETSVTLRLACADDADDIAKFYAHYVLDTVINFEYEAPDAAEFRRRIADVSAKYPFIVAANNHGRVLGYAFAHAMGARPAYGWAVDLSIYLDPDVRGHGLGTALYGALEDILRLQGVVTEFACITVRRDDGLYDLSSVRGVSSVPGLTDSNASTNDPHLPLTSPRFHAAQGFRVVGRDRGCGYKLGTWYDKLWMEKQLADYPESPQPIAPIGSLPNDALSSIFEQNAPVLMRGRAHKNNL